MRTKRMINKLNQIFYRPGKGKFLTGGTLKSLDEMDMTLDKKIGKFTGRRYRAEKKED